MAVRVVDLEEVNSWLFDDLWDRSAYLGDTRLQSQQITGLQVGYRARAGARTGGLLLSRHNRKPSAGDIKSNKVITLNDGFAVE